LEEQSAAVTAAQVAELAALVLLAAAALVVTQATGVMVELEMAEALSLVY
jgi:hypothetical protein